jgi:hypothetical protein
MVGHAGKVEYWEREFTGAAFLGWFRWFGTNATFPFGSLHVSTRAVTVRVGLLAWEWQSVTLSREEVRQITVERRLWMEYVRFVHGKRGTPEYVMFRGGSVEKLLAELRAMGYPVR